jgi:hypothetical protein
LLSEVSSIILSADALDKFLWKDVRELLDEDIYEKLVYLSIEKYLLRNRCELKAAKKVKELLYDNVKALDYLLAMITSHYLSRNVYTKEEISDAIDFGKQWASEYGVPTVYQRVFEFIKAYKVLSAYLVTKNEIALSKFNANCDFVKMETR